MIEQLPGCVSEKKREGRVKYYVDDGAIFHIDAGKNRSQQVFLLLKAELLMKLTEETGDLGAIVKKLHWIFVVYIELRKTGLRLLAFFAIGFGHPLVNLSFDGAGQHFVKKPDLFLFHVLNGSLEGAELLRSQTLSLNDDFVEFGLEKLDELRRQPQRFV